MGNESVKPNDTKLISNLELSIIILCGVLLIVFSLMLSDKGVEGYFHELLKELGIVLFSVFAVSWIYEKLVTKRLLSEFKAALKTQIHGIESISAACAQLGILEIYPTRETYEIKYSLPDFVSRLESGSELKIVAKSLFLLINKPESIKAALTNGINVKLCFFDPNSSKQEFLKLPDLEITDTKSTISTFKKNFGEWLPKSKPKGSLEIRFHQVHLFDSYTTAKLGSRFYGIWDLSFGRSTTEKRIIVVESNHGIGADLSVRYENIWNDATPVFKYKSENIELNKLV
jgi:hypothetical protein